MTNHSEATGPIEPNDIDPNDIDLDDSDPNRIDVTGIDVTGVDVTGVDVNEIDVHGIDATEIEENDVEPSHAARPGGSTETADAPRPGAPVNPVGLTGPAGPLGPLRPVDPADPVGTAGPDAADPPGNRTDPGDGTAPTNPFDEPLVTLRTPAELADALPYLLGFKPEDSIVLIALHGERGQFGGRVRLGIPERAEDWPSVAEQLAQCLVGGCERRGARPDGVIAFLCREPGEAASGQHVVEQLRPLAQVLRTACGALDVPVFEVVCISGGRFWTYCCPDTVCCPPEGTPLLRPGTSVLAAAATYVGVQVSATQSEIRARLTPWQTAAAPEQERALDAAGLALIPRMLSEEAHVAAAETLDLAHRIMARLADAPPVPGTLEADNRDDELIAHDEAAALILGLQVRDTRDRAAEWMEGAEAPAALRLWRALSRRCVGAYAEHAAAPLSLAGWVAWSLGDLAEGQEALDMALCADSEYMFALLLNRACNEDMDPEPIRRCLRRRRDDRDDHGDHDGPDGADVFASPDDSADLSTDEGTSEADASTAQKSAPRRRRRRLPRSPGNGSSSTSHTPHPSGSPGGPRTPGGPSGSRVPGGPGTGPQNRRSTLRGGARNGR
ncbi:DUF4192 family protein [Streptomyces sp. G5(2025)]|uniref:DUF4192 domain-containing protein n=1 Tax=Streptomyces sp. G5(2025) TaxID=3406628 RepID=UPI003C1F81DD